MLWAFYCSHGMGQPESPWVMKPAEMLMQEASVLLAYGGNVQIYENPMGLRSGQLIPWRMTRMRDVGKFVKARRAVCQDTETIPQVAVLHSEHHLRSTPNGKNLMWNVDVSPVQGAVFSLLEQHYGVDIRDEWALKPCMSEYPVIVAPEQDKMSNEMVKSLKEYVKDGGHLLLTGAAAFERFGGEFLGVTKGVIEEKKAYHVPGADGSASLFSSAWRMVDCTTATALGKLATTPLLDERLTKHPYAVLNRVGRGLVLYVPANLFRDFNHNRYPLIRAFVGDLMKHLDKGIGIRVTKAPVSIDFTPRRRGDDIILHFINRASGIPNQTNNGAVDEIPKVGPITMKVKLPRKPRSVKLMLEKGSIKSKWLSKGGVLEFTVDLVRIHAAVVIRM